MIIFREFGDHFDYCASVQSVGLFVPFRIRVSGTRLLASGFWLSSLFTPWRCVILGCCARSFPSCAHAPVCSRVGELVVVRCCLQGTSRAACVCWPAKTTQVVRVNVPAVF